MKTNENHLIDRNALRQLREQHPELSELELAQILLAELKEELLELRQEERLQRNTALTGYAALHPDEQQIRRAMLRTLREKDSAGNYLMTTSRHWLSLMRVLQFLGICHAEYGHCQYFEDLIYRLLKVEETRIACRADNLRKAEETAPLSKPLAHWNKLAVTPKQRRYWEISLCFLSHLQGETSELTSELSPYFRT